MNLLPGLVNPWPKVARAENGEIQRVYSTAEKVDSIEAAIDQIYDHESWRIKAGEAVSREFALCAEPCFGTLEDSGGQYCSTVYTCCEAEDLTVDDLKKIVHPLNWNVCCPSFFQAMAAKPPPKYTRDGWSRIVEVISPEPAKYSLATALIFWMQELDDGSIIINYDLDPNRGEVDSGYVEIDNGYIRVTPTPNPLDGKGVRIETSKQERVGGLSPTATAALACLLGWGDNGKEMLAGTARKLINGELPPGTTLTDWGVSTRPLAAGVQFDTSPPSPPPKIPPKLPPNFPDTVDDSRKLLNSLINRTTKNLGEAGHRWMDGVIRRDVEDVTTQMGTDLKEWSLEVYDTAQDNVKPPKGAN